jgi:hypothetical protein
MAAAAQVFRRAGPVSGPFAGPSVVEKNDLRNRLMLLKAYRVDVAGRVVWASLRCCERGPVHPKLARPSFAPGLFADKVACPARSTSLRRAMRPRTAISL